MTLFYFETCSNIFQSDLTLEKSFRALFCVFYPHIYKSHCILCVLTEPNLGKHPTDLSLHTKKYLSLPIRGKRFFICTSAVLQMNPMRKVRCAELQWGCGFPWCDKHTIFMSLCSWTLLERLVLTDWDPGKKTQDQIIKGTFTSSHLHSQ